MKRTLEKRIMRAVHERDFDDLLKNLGLLDSLVKGELKCNVCGTRLGRENLRFMYPFKDAIAFCCDKPDCYDQVAKMRIKESERM